jgi:hypothetical protein
MTSRLCVVLLPLLVACSCLAQGGLEPAWDHWRHGRVAEARGLAEQALRKDPAGEEARHLLILTAFAQGEYARALDEYGRLKPSSPVHAKLAMLAVEAAKHLGRLDDAVRLARASGQPEGVVKSLDQRRLKPLQVSLEKTTVVPFVKDDPLAALMPAVSVEIDGKPLVAHLDTGGSFIAVSEITATELGVVAIPTGTGEANAQASSVAVGLLGELKIGDAHLSNVPVAVLSALNRTTSIRLILGTNIFEQFLVTWDNGAKRLILSPRHNPARRAEHFKLIPPERASMDFYLQGDHFLFARGAVGEHKDLVFFVDTGLVTMDPQGRQPAMAVKPAVLAEWGMAKEAAEKKFVDAPGPISLGPLSESGQSIMVLDAGKGIPWQGIEVAGLLAHGFLKNYVWTMDFDNHRWYFARIASRHVY